MKKIILLVICFISIFLLASCEKGFFDKWENTKPTDSNPSEVKPAKSNYFDYNGKLHIDGYQVKNQYNEPFQLNGVNMPISTGAHTVWRDLDRIVLLKEWGFNFARMGLSTSRDYNEETLTSLYGALDKFIELGMYVEIVSFIDDTRVENTDGLNRTITFLTLILEKYKNYDNFIYTVGNEPGFNPDGKAISMAQIDQFAEAVIPELKKIKSDIIVGIPTPYACSEADDAALSTLAYDNLIYIAHCYMSKNARTLDLYRRVETAILNNKAIYFSEWSASSPSSTDEYINTDEAKNTVYIINKYKCANAYYNYWPGADVEEDSTVNKVNKMGMIKSTYWNTGRYRDPDALTTGGHFILDVINGKITGRNDITELQDQTILSLGSGDLYYFWASDIRYKIKTISFTNNMTRPSNFYMAWNISESGLGEVYCYVVENGDYFDLIFMSEKKMYFPESAAYFFKNMTALESIDFSNISTENVESMNSMFSGCKSLKNLDLSNFDTRNVTTMFAMFAQMGTIENLDISSFKTPKLSNVISLFNGTDVTNVLNMKNFDFSKVVDLNYAFAGCNPTKLIVSNETQKAFLLSLKSSLKVVIE